MMCRILEVSLECFCHSRVIEVLTYNNNNNNKTALCLCNKITLKNFSFGVCHVCVSKLLITRKKVKNCLLAFQKNSLNNVYYHNSVRIFVQSEINYEQCALFLFALLWPGWARLCLISLVDFGARLSKADFGARLS